MSRTLSLTKISLDGFKSFQHEIVSLNNPLMLVGRNDSGKTNFIEAFAFLADCMSAPLPSVIDSRGGFSKVSCVLKSGTDLDLPISLRLDFAVDDSPKRGYYAVSLGHPAYLDTLRVPELDYMVLKEQCFSYDEAGHPIWFDRVGGDFRTNVAGIRLVLQHRALALPIVGGVQEFASVLRALSDMRVYALDPARIGAVQEQSGTPFLKRDGSNIASILQHMAFQDQNRVQRVDELLKAVIPNLYKVEVVSQPDNRLALSFTQELPLQEGYPSFYGSSVANGTLYALGLIVALMQNPVPSLIAVEEPELYLHPGAMGAVSDWIELAARHTQVLITTHSTELLDAKWIKQENLRIVQKTYGTSISPLGESPVKLLQRHLAGAGELLRSNALDAAPYSEQESPDLFESLAA